MVAGTFFDQFTNVKAEGEKEEDLKDQQIEDTRNLLKRLESATTQTQRALSAALIEDDSNDELKEIVRQLSLMQKEREDFVDDQRTLNERQLKNMVAFFKQVDSLIEDKLTIQVGDRELGDLLSEFAEVQQTETLAQVDARRLIEAQSKVLGQSISSFAAENAASISSTAAARDVGQASLFAISPELGIIGSLLGINPAELATKGFRAAGDKLKARAKERAERFDTIAETEDFIEEEAMDKAEPLVRETPQPQEFEATADDLLDFAGAKDAVRASDDQDVTEVSPIVQLQREARESSEDREELEAKRHKELIDTLKDIEDAVRDSAGGGGLLDGLDSLALSAAGGSLLGRLFRGAGRVGGAALGIITGGLLGPKNLSRIGGAVKGALGTIRGLDIAGRAGQAGTTLMRAAAGAGRAAPGLFGTVGRIGSKALAPLAVGLSAFDVVSGVRNAESILGIKGREVTLGEETLAGTSKLIEGLSLGLVDAQEAARGLQELPNSISLIGRDTKAFVKEVGRDVKEVFGNLGDSASDFFGKLKGFGKNITDKAGEITKEGGSWLRHLLFSDDEENVTTSTVNRETAEVKASETLNAILTGAQVSTTKLPIKSVPDVEASQTVPAPQPVVTNAEVMSEGDLPREETMESALALEAPTAEDIGQSVAAQTATAIRAGDQRVDSQARPKGGRPSRSTRDTPVTVDDIGLVLTNGGGL